MSKSSRDAGRARAGAHLAEILAMMLVNKGIDRDVLCLELELLASARRDDPDDGATAAGLVSLALTLKADPTN